MTLQEVIEASRKLPKIVDVEVEGIGTVRVRRLTTGECVELTRQHKENAGMAMVAAAVVDAEDKPVFGQVVQLEALN